MKERVRVAGSGEVPPREGRCVVVRGRRIALFNTDRGFRAIDADCPHRGGPLFDGMLTGDCVTCPLHGWRVSLADGRACPPNAGRVRVYEVAHADDGIYLVLENGCPRALEGGAEADDRDDAGEAAHREEREAT